MFVLLFLIFFLAPSEVLPQIGDSTNGNKKFNVVIFFAKTSSGELYLDDEGIRYLQFVEKKRVKQTRQTEDLEQYASTGSDCKQLLKGSIYSLITYCRNVLGMSTVIASQESDSFSNSLRFKKSALEDLEIQYRHPKKKSHFITRPEHTEIFKIRSKRQNHIEESNEPEPPPGFDLLGVLKGSLKLTLFGKLLQKENEANPVLQLQTSKTSQALSGGSNRVVENSLFQLVKESLDNIQDCSNGFLLIVLGGSLKDINNAYTDLMQSVKHVVESTDEKNTMIVVTGSCPSTEEAAGTENLDTFIPVFVKGPPNCSDSITFNEQLYDVPYAIKNMFSVL